MFKKIKHLKTFIITILISMVFAVDIGVAFATANDELVKNTITVETDTETVDTHTYLNNVVVNNSTKIIPIGYTYGTVAREINFDYSFSENTDFAVTYELKYEDGTDVNDVILNVVNRDDYIWDQETVLMENFSTVYDASACKGTLYYLDKLQGNGTHTLFSGVTFLYGENKVENYKFNGETDITIGSHAFEVKPYSALEFQQAQLKLARWWDIYSQTSNGITSYYVCRTNHTVGSYTIPAGVVITTTDYETYISNGPGNYTNIAYQCIKDFTSENGDSYQVTDSSMTYTNFAALTLTQAEKANFKVVIDFSSFTPYFNIENYIVTTVFDSYSIGDSVDPSTYATLISSGKPASYFEPEYECDTAFEISANEYVLSDGNTVNSTTNNIITAEEYRTLYVEEQKYFDVNSYEKFENKNLQIELDVWTQVVPTGYTESHYFSNFKTSTSSSAFSNWVAYKQGLTENKLMIYNAHANFENAISFATDFASLNAISGLASAKTDITTAYIYKKNSENNSEFYGYAGGNKYNAGVGVYYLTKTAATLNVQIGVNWYSSNGVKITAMPVNSVNYNDSFEDYSFSKDLAAGHGYVSVLDYIQIITEGMLYDMTGYKLVVTSVSATLTTGGTPSTTPEDITINNATTYSPMLYSPVHTLAPTLKFNITATNNTDTAKKPVIQLTPTLTAYNGLTGIGSGEGTFGVLESLNFNDTSLSGSTFNYDSTVWSCVVSEGVYTFTCNNYIAPKTTINVITGITIASTSLDDWKIDETIYGFAEGSATMYADYWLEIKSELTSSGTVDGFTSTSTSSVEIMTYLTDTAITTTTEAKDVYIGIRNTTSQIISGFTYTAVLIKDGNSANAIDYSSVTFTGRSENRGNSITLSFDNSLNLYPGESLLLCKIRINPGQTNIKLNSSSINATLVPSETVATQTGVHFKRDYASGNLSIINGTAADTTLSVTLDGFSNKASLLNHSANKPNGSQTKWTGTSTIYEYVTAGSSAVSAPFRAGQLLNILSGYTDWNTITGFDKTVS